MEKELLKCLEVVIVQDALELSHLSIDIVFSSHFCIVTIKVCNNSPNELQGSWLCLHLLLDRVCLAQDLLKLRAQEAQVLLSQR